MNNDIVQLTDKNGNNVFPIAGAATQDSISKSMLEEGVFEGPELFPAPTGAYVRTDSIVDDAVTSDKIDWTSVIDKIYPVGSIYMSTANVSPATFMGGTWVQIQDTFLLAAGTTYTAGDTGGEATHTLTVQEMPSHKHSIPYVFGSLNGGGSWITDAGSTSNYNPNATGATGGGQAHNNMPPYLVVYVWQRTA